MPGTAARSIRPTTSTNGTTSRSSAATSKQVNASRCSGHRSARAGWPAKADRCPMVTIPHSVRQYRVLCRKSPNSSGSPKGRTRLRPPDRRSSENHIHSVMNEREMSVPCASHAPRLKLGWQRQIIKLRRDLEKPGQAMPGNLVKVLVLVCMSKLKAIRLTNP